MNFKKFIPAVFLCLSVLPVIFLAVFTFAPVTADLYYSFENGFENSEDGTTPLISYGDMAFIENGASGRALNMQGGTLSVKNSDRISLKNKFSYCAWIKFNDLTSIEPALIKSGQDFYIAFDADFKALNTKISFKDSNNKTKEHIFKSGYLISSGRLKNGWHHVGVVFNEDYLAFYLDGELKTFENLPKELKNYKSILLSGSPFTLGVGENGNINAMVDEIHFKNFAMTAEEMKELYLNGRQDNGAEIIFTLNHNIATKNGVQVALPTNVISDEKSGEILVPAKAVVEFLDGEISWDGNDGFGRADIKIGNDLLSLWVYDTHALLNNNYFKLKTHPVTPDEMLAIPASVLSDAFGAEVVFSENLQRLTILY